MDSTSGNGGADSPLWNREWLAVGGGGVFKFTVSNRHRPGGKKNKSGKTGRRGREEKVGGKRKAVKSMQKG
jgi:hypothetical protein